MEAVLAAGLEPKVSRRVASRLADDLLNLRTQVHAPRFAQRAKDVLRQAGCEFHSRDDGRPSRKVQNDRT